MQETTTILIITILLGIVIIQAVLLFASNKAINDFIKTKK